MKTLVHNGVDVIVQNGQKSFVDTLVSKGISFVELPVLISRQIRVLQYSVNSIVKYAIVELFDGIKYLLLHQHLPTVGMNCTPTASDS